MTDPRLIVAAIADTLETASLWVREPDALMLRETAQSVRGWDGSWGSCPVCQESDCDLGCPLAPYRTQDGLRSVSIETPPPPPPNRRNPS